VMQDACLCALGSSAPNPVISTIRYFRDEYDATSGINKCPAGVCKALSATRSPGEVRRVPCLRDGMLDRAITASVKVPAPVNQAVHQVRRLHRRVQARGGAGGRDARSLMAEAE